MTDLRARMRVYDLAPAPYYWREVELRASAAPEATRPDRGGPRALILAAGLLVVLVISAAVAVGSGIVDFLPDETPTPAPSTDQPAWTGPVRSLDGEPVVEPMVIREDGTWTWDEPQESIPDWLDIVRLLVAPDGQVTWYLQLADWPQGDWPQSDLDAGTVIAHGLVVDGTGDGDADHVIGIDNDVPEPGDFHVWVTHLHDGVTDEQIGPPYGRPVEFSHPAESGSLSSPTVVFTFLAGLAPDIDVGSMRWYAWSSASVAGEVVAWDYSPNTAWVGRHGTQGASELPRLRMPATTASRAGEYGTTLAPTTRSWSAGMHNVEGFGETQITFAAKDDCFANGEASEPVPITIAGFDGLYVEPYEDPSVQFGRANDGSTTRAYALPIDDRTLCVYLTWDPTTTPDELDAARSVVESIRAQIHYDGIRINFTLPGGWDTG